MNKIFEDWLLEFDYIFDDRVKERLTFKSEAFEMFKAAQPQWQPIETAPKDESLFVIANFRDYSPPFIARGWWSEISQCYKYTGGNNVYHLTHWMPLPNPPEIENK